MRWHAASLLLLLLLLAVGSSAGSDDTDTKQQQEQQQQQQPNDIEHLVTDNFADVIERQPGPALVRVATHRAACVPHAELQLHPCQQLGGVQKTLFLSSTRSPALICDMQVMFMITDCEACRALTPDLRKVAANLKVQQQLLAPCRIRQCYVSML
jgi:hypothetical protein